MTKVRFPKKSLLDSATRCFLLHEGGEACVYGLSVEGRGNLVLKWYKSHARFDGSVISSIANSPVDGLYRILEFGEREGTPYVLYEFIDGVASAEYDVIPVAEALVALRQVAKTLSALSEKGSHHGDLSPSNVLLTATGDTVLIDFGLVGLGAYAYAAPERFRGRTSDARSDMYSLGLLLYHWICGRDLVETDVVLKTTGKLDSLDPFVELKPTEKLYETGIFSPGELAALEPIWTGLLRNSPEERFEDFDELDEVLEIALYKVCGGEIAILKNKQNLAGRVEKMLQNVPAFSEPSDFGPFPYHIAQGVGKKFPVKLSVLCGLGLILLIVVAVLVFGDRNPDIDDVASMVLENSRNLELKDLPASEVNP